MTIKFVVSAISWCCVAYGDIKILGINFFIFTDIFVKTNLEQFKSNNYSIFKMESMSIEMF